MKDFKSVTVFVLSYDETDLLCETIHKVREFCSDEDLQKIIVILPSDQCPSFAQAQKMMQEDAKISVHIQKHPGICGAFADLEPLMDSSHFVVMASDMEMDPRTLAKLIESAKKHPERIVSASKWMPGATVEGYGKLHALCSSMLSKTLGLIIGRKATDLISVFEVYPTWVYRDMHFETVDEFLYDMTIKPLSMGVPYEEIPTSYRKRPSGKTHFNLPSLAHHALGFLKAAWHYRKKS